MIRSPQQENRQYSTPTAKKREMVPDGTRVRCTACRVDLFGIFENNELHIKYRGRNVVMETGRCRIRCRSCSYENIISLKEIKVNLQVYDEESEIIEITSAALKLAEEENVLIRNVIGTGKEGRITIRDIREFIDR